MSLALVRLGPENPHPGEKKGQALRSRVFEQAIQALKPGSAWREEYSSARASPGAQLALRDFSRLLAELHRDSLYPMMGKDAWMAGADAREAPGPKPVRLGPTPQVGFPPLRLRRQPPGSWQLWNGGDQREVSVSLYPVVSDRMPSARPRHGRPACSRAVMTWARRVSILNGSNPPRDGFHVPEGASPAHGGRIPPRSAAGQARRNIREMRVEDHAFGFGRRACPPRRREDAWIRLPWHSGRVRSSLRSGSSSFGFSPGHVVGGRRSAQSVLRSGLLPNA